MAITFGGDDTPPGMFSGTDETKNVQRWCSLHRRARLSKSNSSPSMISGYEQSIVLETYRSASPSPPAHTRAKRPRPAADTPPS